jgi:hypothetical protein
MERHGVPPDVHRTSGGRTEGIESILWRSQNKNATVKVAFSVLATPRGFDLNSGIVISITSSGRFPKRAPRTH